MNPADSNIAELNLQNDSDQSKAIVVEVADKSSDDKEVRQVAAAHKY
jgi:hypothetical protein